MLARTASEGVKITSCLGSVRLAGSQTRPYDRTLWEHLDIGFDLKI